MPPHRGDQPAENASDTDERLWIFFQKICDEVAPITLESTLCRACGFIFNNPRLTYEDVRLKYQTIAELGFDQHRHARRPREGMSERQERVVQWLARACDLQSKTNKLSVLDYGGAEGQLLVPLAERGHHTGVLDYIRYPMAHPEIHYLGQDLGDLPDGAAFDIILLLHTLEHVTDPVGLLSSLAKTLRPEGILYIEVPLGAWLEWEFLREPITHVNFFSEQSLVRAAREAGLVPVVLETRWQWVTRERHACINLIVQKEQARRAAKIPPPRNTLDQMAGLSYALDALGVNPAYYGKLIARHYAKKWLPG